MTRSLWLLQRQVEEALDYLRYQYLREGHHERAKQVPSNYRQLKTAIDRLGGYTQFRYDVCPEIREGKYCFAIYRCEFKDCLECPLRVTQIREWQASDANALQSDS